MTKEGQVCEDPEHIHAMGLELETDGGKFFLKEIFTCAECHARWSSRREVKLWVDPDGNVKIPPLEGR